MNLEEVKVGDILYCLDRGCFWDSNVIEVVVEEDKEGLVAKGNQDPYTLKVPVKKSFNKQILFKTREEAEQVYNKEIEKEVKVIKSKSKEEILSEMYDAWVGDHLMDVKESEAMRSRIQELFGVGIHE